MLWDPIKNKRSELGEDRYGEITSLGERVMNELRKYIPKGFGKVSECVCSRRSPVQLFGEQDHELRVDCTPIASFGNPLLLQVLDPKEKAHNS